jgi:hypothetical protein
MYFFPAQNSGGNRFGPAAMICTIPKPNKWAHEALVITHGGKSTLKFPQLVIELQNRPLTTKPIQHIPHLTKPVQNRSLGGFNSGLSNVAAISAWDLTWAHTSG